MGDQYYVDEYDEEPDMDELMGYMSPDEGDGDLAGFERPEMNVDFSTAVVVSNLPQVCTRAMGSTICTHFCAFIWPLPCFIGVIEDHVDGCSNLSTACIRLRNQKHNTIALLFSNCT